MIKKFEVPEGYEENLKAMVEREVAYLKDQKQTHGIHFKEDNMIYQLTTWLETYDAREAFVAQTDNTE